MPGLQALLRPTEATEAVEPAVAAVAEMVIQAAAARLAALAESNPVFAPGVENYVAMGGVRALWRGDLAAQLREALAHTPTTDERARDGAERGGRRLAAEVARRVAEHPAQA